MNIIKQNAAKENSLQRASEPPQFDKNRFLINLSFEPEIIKELDKLIRLASPSTDVINELSAKVSHALCAQYPCLGETATLKTGLSFTQQVNEFPAYGSGGWHIDRPGDHGPKRCPYTINIPYPYEICTEVLDSQQTLLKSLLSDYLIKGTMRDEKNPSLPKELQKLSESDSRFLTILSTLRAELKAQGSRTITGVDICTIRHIENIIFTTFPELLPQQKQPGEFEVFNRCVLWHRRSETKPSDPTIHLRFMVNIYLTEQEFQRLRNYHNLYCDKKATIAVPSISMADLLGKSVMEGIKECSQKEISSLPLPLPLALNDTTTASNNVNEDSQYEFTKMPIKS